MRTNTLKCLDVLNAYLKGKTIICDDTEWNIEDNPSPMWDFYGHAYSIKTEPTYIPYTRENLDNMDANDRILITPTNGRSQLTHWNSSQLTITQSGHYSYKEVLARFKHLNGKPFGKLKP